MNWIDIACAACLLIFGVIGLWRGLLGSIFRLCAWVAAIAGAYFSQSLFCYFVMQNFEFSEFTARLICISIGFLIPFLLFSFIGHIVGDSIKNTIVGKTNHILGALFGLVKATLVCFVLLFILHLLPVQGNLKDMRDNAIAYSIYKSSLEKFGYSSDEVNLRKMAKEKASELTKTITDKAKGSEEAADSLKSVAKETATKVSDKVSETAAKAKDAAIAAKDAAVKSLQKSKNDSTKKTKE